MLEKAAELSEVCCTSQDPLQESIIDSTHGRSAQVYSFQYVVSDGTPQSFLLLHC